MSPTTFLTETCLDMDKTRALIILKTQFDFDEKECEEKYTKWRKSIRCATGIWSYKPFNGKSIIANNIEAYASYYEECRKDITKQQILKIADLWDVEMTGPQISKELNINYTIVRGIIRNLINRGFLKKKFTRKGEVDENKDFKPTKRSRKRRNGTTN